MFFILKPKSMLNKLKCTAIVSILSISAFAQQPILIDVDVKLNADTFFVKLQVPQKLSKNNNIFQFPATAPGTYQTMNIGRLVSSFEAYDKKGKLLKTEFKRRQCPQRHG
jgi:hypothetical protein